MSITPYQILVPLVSLVAIGYAWSLFVRTKKTLWEVLLWSAFWIVIACIALFPELLSHLTAATGIKDRANAVFISCIGILFFFMFYVIVRLEELEQRQTRIVRALAIKEAELTKPPRA